jgi:phage terminase small subunit
MDIETTTPTPDDPRDNSELIKLYPNIASQLDAATLDLFGELFETWRAAMAKVRADGMVDILPGGIQRVSPCLKAAHDAHDRMVRILSSYGMTPRSRAMGRGASLLRQQKPNPFAAIAAKHVGRGNPQ